MRHLLQHWRALGSVMAEGDKDLSKDLYSPGKEMEG